MFAGNRKQLATIVGQRIRVKDARQQDTNHILEFDFEVPLTVDLADEVLPDLKRDIFDDEHPKPYMGAVDFVVPGLVTQRLTVTAHPDMPAFATFTAVMIRGTHAKKADEGKSWLLGFTAGWTFRGDTSELALMKCIKKGSVFLSLEAEQQSLLEQQPAATDQPAPRTRKAKGTESKGRSRKAKGPAAVHEIRPGVSEQFDDKGDATQGAAEGGDKPPEPTTH